MRSKYVDVDKFMAVLKNSKRHTTLNRLGEKKEEGMQEQFQAEVMTESNIIMNGKIKKLHSRQRGQHEVRSVMCLMNCKQVNVVRGLSTYQEVVR